MNAPAGDLAFFVAHLAAAVLFAWVTLILLPVVLLNRLLPAGAALFGAVAWSGLIVWQASAAEAACAPVTVWCDAMHDIVREVWFTGGGVPFAVAVAVTAGYAFWRRGRAPVRGRAA